MRGLVFAIGILAAAGTAQAGATVGVEHGNIVVNGKAVTHSGHDGDPVASPDGRRIVFLREIADKPVSDCSGGPTETPNAELWSMNRDGSDARKLLGVKPDNDMKKTICAFDGAQFSSDGNLLYFETPAWATSGAIHVYDFRARKEHFVVDGDDLMVLAKCDEPEYRDKLIVTQHRYFAFSGSYDWPWLISPQGRTLGLVGGENADLEAVVKYACG